MKHPKGRGRLNAVWRLENDDSRPILTAEKQVKSAHRNHDGTRCSETAIIFFMSRGLDYVKEICPHSEAEGGFPCFLQRRQMWTADGMPVCFLYGGAGAPMAADTVETLAALGAKNILSIGMCGGFSDKVRPGELILPEKALVEEGTSLHYYGTIEYAEPDAALHGAIASALKTETHPIVSTDAVYRQTFKKEEYWREKGAVGVDMETSAVFSVSKYLGLRSVALLMVSDVHPLKEGEPEWKWHMTPELRRELAEKSVAAVRIISEMNR